MYKMLPWISFCFAILVGPLLAAIVVLRYPYIEALITGIAIGGGSFWGSFYFLRRLTQKVNTPINPIPPSGFGSYAKPYQSKIRDGE